MRRAWLKFCPVFGQVFRVFQKEVMAAFHLFRKEFSLFRPHLAKGIVYVLDQLERIKGDLGIRQGLSNPLMNAFDMSKLASVIFSAEPLGC